MEPFSEDEDPFLHTSQGALRTSVDALATLGWTELLPFIDLDPEARLAIFALFRAQGRELSTTEALGLLMAQPYSALMRSEDGMVSATIEVRSGRKGTRTMVIGVPRDGMLLVDRHGLGASLVDCSTVRLRHVDLPGRLSLHEVEFESSRLRVDIPDEELTVARRTSLSLGRLAVSCELLGAAESTLAIAVEYASNRIQFGAPIGRFQAVRHLLAESRVDCAAVQAVSEQAIVYRAQLPPSYDKVTKALAGRNGRRVCERTLQVLGGIGFTAEHPHHHFHSRVLSLDTLLGSSAELAHQLAVEWRSAETQHPLLTGVDRCELLLA